jgi:hypothetical protein
VTERVGARVAKQTFCQQVEEHDAPSRVDHDQRIGRAVQQLANELRRGLAADRDEVSTHGRTPRAAAPLASFGLSRSPTPRNEAPDRALCQVCTTLVFATSPRTFYRGAMPYQLTSSLAQLLLMAAP